MLDLNETVRGMRDLLRSTIGGAIQVEITLEPEPWPALVDPTQLESPCSISPSTRATPCR